MRFWQSTVSKTEVAEHKAQASGATLLVAGAIEIDGGKTTLPGRDEDVSLWANIGSHRLGLTIVTPQVKGADLSFIVPEPVRENTVLGVLTKTGHCHMTACVDIIDLTHLPRVNMGGFSIIQLVKRSAREFKIEPQLELIRPMGSLAELA